MKKIITKISALVLAFVLTVTGIPFAECGEFSGLFSVQTAATTYFDAGVCYGYNYLGTLSDGAVRQSAYRTIAEFCDDYTYSDKTASLSTDGLYKTGGIDLSSYGLSMDTAIDIAALVRTDNPQFYWFGSTINARGNSSGCTTVDLTVEDDYITPAQRSVYNSIVENAIDDYMSETAGLTTDYEKILAVYHKLAYSAYYLYESAGVPSTEDYAHNIIGILNPEIGGGVCESYAKVFQLMLNELGIQNTLAGGWGKVVRDGVSLNEAHAWNMLKLDGKWYWCDPTWDDSTGKRDIITSAIDYEFFLPKSSDFESTHTKEAVSESRFAYPTMSSTAYAHPSTSKVQRVGTTFTVSGVVYGVIYDSATKHEVAVVDASGYNFASNGYTIAFPTTVTNNGTAYTITALDRRSLTKIDGLHTILLPEKITYIGKEAFRNCDYLTDVTIAGATTIKFGAFAGCNALKSIAIPTTTTEIGEKLFTDLKYESDGSITIQGTNTDVVVYAKSTSAARAYCLANSITTKTYSGTYIGLCTVSALANRTYSGSAIKPTVTVKRNGTTLVSGTDYTLTYSNNTNAGTATVAITGTGSYGGVVSKSFTIVPKSIATGTATLELTERAYNGSERYCGDITLSVNSKTLVRGTDYYVNYSNNINIGTATVTMTGRGNYTGTLLKTFEIVGEALQSSWVTLSYTTTTYNGANKKPTVTVKDGTTKLVNGTDYTVTYPTDRKSAGYKTITITGKGDYSGTVTKTYRIKAKSVATLSLTLSSTSMVYNGSARKPAITLMDGTYKLVQGTDYTVAYSNNTAIGKATVVVTGIGNYRSTYTTYFNVIPKTVAGLKMTARTTNSISVSWTKLSGITGYQVFVRYPGDSSYTQYKTISGKNNNTLDITGLNSGKTYRIRVRAYKTVNSVKIYGKYSSYISKTTK